MHVRVRVRCVGARGPLRTVWYSTHHLLAGRPEPQGAAASRCCVAHTAPPCLALLCTLTPLRGMRTCCPTTHEPGRCMRTSASEATACAECAAWSPLFPTPCCRQCCHHNDGATAPALVPHCVHADGDLASAHHRGLLTPPPSPPGCPRSSLHALCAAERVQHRGGHHRRRQEVPRADGRRGERLPAGGGVTTRRRGGGPSLPWSDGRPLHALRHPARVRFARGDGNGRL